jgi:hypothetical protein
MNSRKPIIFLPFFIFFPQMRAWIGHGEGDEENGPIFPVRLEMIRFFSLTLALTTLHSSALLLKLRSIGSSYAFGKGKGGKRAIILDIRFLSHIIGASGCDKIVEVQRWANLILFCRL